MSRCGSGNITGLCRVVIGKKNEKNGFGLVFKQWNLAPSVSRNQCQAERVAMLNMDYGFARSTTTGA